jgi:hypothetical protein
MLGPFHYAIKWTPIHMNVQKRHENAYEFSLPKKGEDPFLYPYHLPIGRRKDKALSFGRDPLGVAEKEEEKDEKPKKENPQSPKP